jgi:RNA polymerase sigma-70 factor (ECF subfamily)
MDLNKSLIEQVLILRCQLGDREALAELIRQYERPLRYFLSCLLGNSQVTEDVFQNTWLIVIRKIYSLKKPQAFSTWLYRIARNCAYKELKRKKLLKPLHEDMAAPNETEDREDSSADAAKIHICLKELRHEHKEVLVLRFLEQMSYEQIAQVTNCNIGTVRSRIYYAKQALKRELEV